MVSELEKAYKNPDKNKLITSFLKSYDPESIKKVGDSILKRLHDKRYQYEGGGVFTKKNE